MSPSPRSTLLVSPPLPTIAELTLSPEAAPCSPGQVHYATTQIMTYPGGQIGLLQLQKAGDDTIGNRGWPGRPGLRRTCPVIIVATRSPVQYARLPDPCTSFRYARDAQTQLVSLDLAATTRRSCTQRPSCFRPLPVMRWRSCLYPQAPYGPPYSQLCRHPRRGAPKSRCESRHTPRYTRRFVSGEEEDQGLRARSAEHEGAANVL